MAKTLATQRSLKKLRKEGWTCCIVEKFLPARGSMKFPRRIDAFGIGDILACNPDEVLRGAECGIALIQTFPLARWNDHKEKILALPEFQKWKDSNGSVVLHGWRFGGPRGEKKRWILREEIL